MNKLISNILKILSKETMKSINITLTGKVLTTFIGLSTITLLARSLSLEDFNKVTICFVMIELLNFISIPGGNILLNKSIHHKKVGVYKSIYRFSFYTSVLFSFFIITMAVALGNIFEIQSKYFDIKLIIFSLVFISLRTYEKHHDVLPAFKRFKELTYLLVFSSLLRFSGLGLTAYFTKNINIVLIGGVFYQFTLSYLSYSTCKKYLKESNEKIDYIKESLQLTLTHFVTISCNSIDKAFVSFINPSLIGLYEAGTMYTFKSQEFVNTISNTITNSWADYGKNEFVVRYNRNKYLLLFSGLVFSLLLYLSADFYIPLLLGDNYIDSIPIAKTSSILIFLKISTYFYSKYILIFQNIKEYNKKIIISRTILLVTCFPFIHYFGLKGAVYSLIFSELILLLMIRKIKNLGTI